MHNSINDSIIFDIDGTLWNACPASAIGWTNGLKKLGIEREVTAHEIQSVAGHPVDECVEILFPGMRGSYPGFMDVLEAHEIEAIKIHGGVFYEGVIDGIAKLAMSHRLFIVSNCQEWYLKMLIDRSGFGDAIESFDCNGMSGQPKSIMLGRMKDRFSLKAPVYIGDTPSDQEAADLAGIGFIHAAYGFGNCENAVTFDNFYDLTNYFAE